MPEITFIQLDPLAQVPSAQHDGDAGYDLHATTPLVLSPGGGRGLVGTGIAIGLPFGYAGFVQPRSGLALKHGITCLNSPGLIDAGYRDELKVILINTDPTDPYEVFVGDRIAQLVIQKVENVTWVQVETLTDSRRSKAGFGSTGK